MAAAGKKGEAFTPGDFRGEYIRFMRAPGSHNDTYASTAHRMFFANHAKGVDPEECQANDGHNTDAIDCLTLVVPLVVKRAGGEQSREELHREVVEMINVTRRTRALDRYATAYADLLVAVLEGADLRTAIEEVNAKYFRGSIKKAVESSRGVDPMVACYIDSSFPALLHFAYKCEFGAEGVETLLSTATNK